MMMRSKLFFISLVFPLMALVFTPGLSFAMGSKGGFVEPQGDKKDKEQGEKNLENTEEGETRSIEKETDDGSKEKSSLKKKRRLKYMEEGS